MRVLQVASSVDEEADGVASAVLGLTENMVAYGYDVSLACATPLTTRILPPQSLTAASYQLVKWNLNIGLMKILSKAAKNFEIIHNHGLWNPINIAAGFVVPGKRAKLVTSPHGTLTEWALANSKYKKKALWPLQKRVLACADLIHVTSESELLDVRRAGFKCPVAVISIGIDFLPQLESRGLKESNTLLFLSRIHEKKGIDNLLYAWCRVQNDFPNWRVVIAGKGDRDYVNYIQGLAAQLAVRRVEFIGPKYGAEKNHLYAEADIFVLPTHSENFGIVVAEALVSGCPVVVGKGAPWEGVRRHGCGWWIDNNVDELATTLNVAMSTKGAVLREMGEAGRSWMHRDFSWLSMVQKMNTSYQWLLEGGSRPDWVVVD